jgi:hypothetical protein
MSVSKLMWSCSTTPLLHKFQREHIPKLRLLQSLLMLIVVVEESPPNSIAAPRVKG